MNLVATWFYLAFSMTSIISKTLVNLPGLRLMSEDGSTPLENFLKD